MGDWLRTGSFGETFGGKTVESVLLGGMLGNEGMVGAREIPPGDLGKEMKSYDFYGSHGYLLCSFHKDIGSVAFSPMMLYMWQRDVLSMQNIPERY